jgi:hypothetical protein
MKKHLTHIYTGRFHTRMLLIISAMLFALLTSLGVLSLSQQASAETSASYCAKYTTNAALIACKAGVRGDDCSDYAITHDQSIADVCSAAASAKASGQINDTNSPTPTTTSGSTDAEVYRNNIVLSCSQYDNDQTLSSWCLYGGLGTNGNNQKPKTVSECLTNTAIASQPRLQGACVTGATAGRSFLENKNGNSQGSQDIASEGFALQDILDQTQSLSDLIDIMHAAGEFAGVDMGDKPSNDYDGYTNGAGKKQKINVHPCVQGAGQAAAGAAQSSAQEATQIGYDQGFQAGLQAGQQTSSYANNAGSFNNQGGFNNFNNLDSYNNTNGQFGEYNPFDVSTVNNISDLFNIGPGAQTGYQDGYQQGYQSTGGLQGLTGMLSGLGGLGGGGGLGSLGGLLGGLGGGNTANNGGSMIGNFGVAGTGCPALLWFNGGGWHSNDGTAALIATGSANKNGSDQMAQHGPPPHGGANARGYTVIEVTYRLGSSGVYYMLEDVLRGIQHVRNNAGMYGIDPSKIAIGGDSAGGSLAVRAGSTGRSGAKAMIGWSPPTNAYTGLFRSYKSLMIGMDHSTCIPTDLAGLTNFTDLLNGGSGEVAEYGQGLLSNDFTGIGIGQGVSGAPTGIDGGGFDAIGTITQVLLGAQYLADTGQNIEAITSQLQSGNPLAMSGSLINLSSKKLVECLDNFNTLSPALFASPDSPPGFFGGFDTDDVVGPEQVTGMRDKLRSLGIRSEALVLQGDGSGGSAFGPNNDHMGYDPRFVCVSINFLDEIMRPDVERPNCDEAGAPAAPPAPDTNAGGGGGGGSGSGSNSGGNSSQGYSGNAGDSCTRDGRPGKLEKRGDEMFCWITTKSDSIGKPCTENGRVGTVHSGRRGTYCYIPPSSGPRLCPDYSNVGPPSYAPTMKPC